MAPSREKVVNNVDPNVLYGGAAVATVVATHPLWLSALGLKKPKDESKAEGGDDLTEVREYFNNVGFERWNKIYSDSDEVNKVQMDIRDGHQVTIDTVLSWVDEAGNGVSGKTVCDLGCGVGTLAIPMAQRGAKVSASDISSSMATEAARRAKEMGITSASFEASDLESVNGKFDTVTCIDVMIHYPTDKMQVRLVVMVVVVLVLLLLLELLFCCFQDVLLLGCTHLCPSCSRTW